ncbi:hypothetical protein EV715DRAFT_200649 [Schizophyllum commune]
MKEPALVLDTGSTPASIRARPASPTYSTTDSSSQSANSATQPPKPTSSASSPVVSTQPAKAATLSPSATHPAILAASASADAQATFATHPAVLAISPPTSAAASAVASAHKPGTYQNKPRTAPVIAPPPKPLFTRKTTAPSTSAASGSSTLGASASGPSTASASSTSNTAHPPQALTFKHLQVVYKLENDGTWTCRLCAALSKTRKFGKEA